MGEVWRATDTMLGRTVAVKLLKPEFADDPGFRSPLRDRGPARRRAAPPGRRGGLRLRRQPSTPRRATVPYLVMELRRRPAAVRNLLRAGQPMAAGRRPATCSPRPPTRVAAAHAAGHRAPRHQAGQPAGHPGRPGQDHRLRHRPGRRGRGPHPDRPGDGHPAVPLPRAGRGQARHRGQRRLLARRRRLRVPGRPPAVRGRQPGRHRARPRPRADPAAARRRPRRSRRHHPAQPGQGPRRAVRRRGRVRRRPARPCRDRTRFLRSETGPATAVLTPPPTPMPTAPVPPTAAPEAPRRRRGVSPWLLLIPILLLLGIVVWAITQSGGRRHPGLRLLERADLGVEHAAAAVEHRRRRPARRRPAQRRTPSTSTPTTTSGGRSRTSRRSCAPWA